MPAFWHSDAPQTAQIEMHGNVPLIAETPFSRSLPLHKHRHDDVHVAVVADRAEDAGRRGG